MKISGATRFFSSLLTLLVSTVVATPTPSTISRPAVQLPAKCDAALKTINLSDCPAVTLGNGETINDQSYRMKAPGKCSEACLKAIRDSTDVLQEACHDVMAPSGTVLDLVLSNRLMSLLCPSIPASTAKTTTAPHLATSSRLRQQTVTATTTMTLADGSALTRTVTSLKPTGTASGDGTSNGGGSPFDAMSVSQSGSGKLSVQLNSCITAVAAAAVAVAVVGSASVFGL